jgi:glycosyltransferase involved in cell wall biosynthesis
MDKVPSISIVTPSFNQGRYLGETLQSLVDQQYPRLEVIIQDGGSTDGAVAVAEGFVQRFPSIFRLYVEKDAGQADALNRGFARTTGEILGFLNSDDTLYPGCLPSVARAIDPASRRWIVFGRCLFTGEGSRYVGVEHPAQYKSHFELLAIWKRGHNTLPQPSVFWHRKVWEQCGGFNQAEHHVLDYDLFCRFSRRFRFHKVDELWSTYRMHAVSKSSQRTEAEILDLSIAVSRRYWGSWLNPLRWRCEVSHWLHDRHLHEHARHHARRAEEAGHSGRKLTALVEFLKTLMYSPAMARDRLLRAWLSANKLKFLHRLLWRKEAEFAGHYGDGWIGPVYRTEIAVPPNAARLSLELKHIPQGAHERVSCTLKLGRRVVARHEAAKGEEFFVLTGDLSAFRGKPCAVELRCDSFFVPRHVHNTPDDRRLALLLLATRIELADGI